ELAEIALEIKDYHQCAEQWKIVHENPHQNAAYEYLLPHGPYVVLPTTEPCTSKLIWCHEEDGAEYDLESQLIAHFPPALGEVSLLEHISAYPLNLQRAKSSYNGRVVLIGDAYQRVHPVAAQGLNIGLRDAQALAASLIDAQRLGLDHGTPHRLEGFHQQRRFDRFLVRSLTDFLGDKAGFDTPLFWRLHRVLGKLFATRPARCLIREIFHGE
ncbi:MAG: FAD-dependent monooxygenase, partial [Alphaproteobacteria bacterium]|nr:FAD-dependent monooxygenase [Alphaproteobacteria bacterium]